MLINFHITYTGHIAEQLTAAPAFLETMVPVDITVKDLKEKFIIPLIRRHNDLYNDRDKKFVNFSQPLHQLAQQLTCDDIIVMHENELLNDGSFVRDKRNKKNSIVISTDLLRYPIAYTPIPKNSNFIRLINITIFLEERAVSLLAPNNLRIGAFKKDYVLPYMLDNPNFRYSFLSRLHPKVILEAIEICYQARPQKDQTLISNISDDLRFLIVLKNSDYLSRQCDSLKNKCLSFFAGHHPKLGMNSHIKILPQYVAKKIVTMVLKDEAIKLSATLTQKIAQPSTFYAYMETTIAAPKIAPGLGAEQHRPMCSMRMITITKIDELGKKSRLRLQIAYDQNTALHVKDLIKIVRSRMRGAFYGIENSLNYSLPYVVLHLGRVFTEYEKLPPGNIEVEIARSVNFNLEYGGKYCVIQNILDSYPNSLIKEIIKYVLLHDLGIDLRGADTILWCMGEECLDHDALAKFDICNLPQLSLTSNCTTISREEKHLTPPDVVEKIQESRYTLRKRDIGNLSRKKFEDLPWPLKITLTNFLKKFCLATEISCVDLWNKSSSTARIDILLLKLKENKLYATQTSEIFDAAAELHRLALLTPPRTGLSDIRSENLTKLLQLPGAFAVGTAVDDGGCFFDALAQTLNQVFNTQQHTEKTLRLKCHEYYSKHKDEVEQWNRRDYQGIDQGDDYYFIQYTKPELDKNFHGRSPTWGRPEIEGRILCQQLSIPCIHLIELRINPEDNAQYMVTHFNITAEGEKQTDNFQYDSKIPTVIVSQKKLHFVPLLQREALELKSREKCDRNNELKQEGRLSEATELTPILARLDLSIATTSRLNAPTLMIATTTAASNAATQGSTTTIRFWRVKCDLHGKNQDYTGKKISYKKQEKAEKDLKQHQETEHGGDNVGAIFSYY